MHHTFVSLCLAASFTAAAEPAAAARALSDKEKLDKDPHLVGWWKLDDPTGSTALDASAYGRKGTLKGGLSFERCSAPGRIGKALAFDSRDGFVEIAGYKGVTGTRPRTIVAWIKTKNDRGEILSWGTEELGTMWNFRIVGSGIFVNPQGGYLYTNSPVHDDKWHCVAAVLEPAEHPTLNDVKLYKDGVRQEIHDIGILDLYPIETGDKLDVRMGRGFTGCMDDVRLYDRALSPKEVATLSSGEERGAPSEQKP